MGETSTQVKIYEKVNFLRTEIYHKTNSYSEIVLNAKI